MVLRWKTEVITVPEMFDWFVWGEGLLGAGLKKLRWVQKSNQIMTLNHNNLNTNHTKIVMAWLQPTETIFKKMWCASSSNHTQLWFVANHNPQFYPHSPLLTVLHGTVDGIACSANDITLCSTPQQSFDGLNASKAAGDMKRRLPVIVQLVHPRAQPRTHDLNEERRKRWTAACYCAV